MSYPPPSGDPRQPPSGQVPYGRPYGNGYQPGGWQPRRRRLGLILVMVLLVMVLLLVAGAAAAFLFAADSGEAMPGL